MYRNHQKVRTRNIGFSLVEMLVVISIITVMAVLVRPAVASLLQAQGFSSNVTNLNDIIQQAKAAASAQNTFVWLGFAATTVNGRPTVLVSAVAGKTGLSSDYSSNNTYPIMKPVSLPNVMMVPCGNYTSIPNLAGFYSTTLAMDCSQSTYGTFTQSVAGTNTTFQSVIAFSPDGEAGLSPNSISKVGIGLQAGPVLSASAQVALIQISGASGRPSVFRE